MTIDRRAECTHDIEHVTERVRRRSRRVRHGTSLTRLARAGPERAAQVSVDAETMTAVTAAKRRSHAPLH